MNILQITSIDTALKIYYSYSEISNKEIVQLFGRMSSATLAKLKLLAKTEMDKCDMMSYGIYKVNTVVAYIVWGIDVFDLEKRWKKLKELAL